MTNCASYILSAYSFIFTETLEQILNVGYQSMDGNPIPSFDENLLIDLCTETQNIFEKESNILEIEGDVTIVGDIHGSLHDLLRILKFIQENKSKALFLGDYVDRGNFSLECITILFAYKITNPDSVFLIRGNHEFDQLCSQYGFKNEILNYHNLKIYKNTDDQSSKKSQSNNKEQYKQCKEYLASHNDTNCYKYSERLYDSFIQAFSYLPICAILNHTTFCIHGGLSPKLEEIDQINTQIKRPIKTFEENPLLSDVVWGDPSHDSTKYDENPRGRGYLFNREAVSTFLRNTSLVRMIRAHQCVRKGYLNLYNDKCLTVFSASSYDKLMGNSSSVLQLFQKDDRINVVTFLPLRRLDKGETVYCKVQPLNPAVSDNHTYFSKLHPTLFAKSSLKLPPKMPAKVTAKKPFRQTRPVNLPRLTTPLAKSKFITKPRQSYQYEQPPLQVVESTDDDFISMNMNSAP